MIMIDEAVGSSLLTSKNLRVKHPDQMALAVTRANFPPCVTCRVAVSTSSVSFSSATELIQSDTPCFHVPFGSAATDEKEREVIPCM